MVDAVKVGELVAVIRTSPVVAQVVGVTGVIDITLEFGKITTFIRVWQLLASVIVIS